MHLSKQLVLHISTLILSGRLADGGMLGSFVSLSMHALDLESTSICASRDDSFTETDQRCLLHLVITHLHLHALVPVRRV